MPTDTEIYCDLMGEVRGRLGMIYKVMNKKVELNPDIARLEFVILLLRKSLEQIALSSLISNREAFCTSYSNFEKAWHARLILQDIQRVNPDFYPIPVEEFVVPAPGEPRHLRTVTEGFLTREEFVKVYDKCGALLHASNPFGSKPDYEYFDRNIEVWATKIARLLERHLIKLANSETLYLVHMRETDGKVRHYTINPLEAPRT